MKYQRVYFVRLILALFIFLLPSDAFAGQLEKGTAAFERQDYRTALNLWRPLAEKGGC